jgi:hypothetical protein
MNKRLLWAIALVFFNVFSPLQAQVLFEGLVGQPLLDSLVAHFKPDSVLDYTQSRDTLYSKVLALDDDSLRCIYSGHTLYLAPNQDPTQYVYLNGTSDGINAEHAYPQSKGAANGNARSDMHHLYPTRIPVNEARADLPFGEIPDAQAQKWFYKNQVMTSIPAVNKDAYSEYKANLFEPRESVKGDLARSIFYFYTMYRAQADLADPNYFELQRAALCQWQEQDPADQAELQKTWRIAAYQENKPNPFVLDCTLAFRTYCPQIPASCISSTDSPALPAMEIQVAPNPFSGQARANIALPFSGNVDAVLRNALGQELYRIHQDDAPAGLFSWDIQVRPGLGSGFLEVHLTAPNGRRISRVGAWISY